MSSTKVLVTNESPAAQFNPFKEEHALSRLGRFELITQTRGKNERNNTSRTDSRRKTEFH